MKVVVNELDACKRGLEVEIPGSVVSEEMERALRAWSRRVRIPGFRPGRIPVEIVRRRFGKEIRDEVIDRMAREYASRALEERRLEPVRAPVLDDISYEEGSPLIFRATFEVRPAVSVTDYRSPSVTVRRRRVTDEMIRSSLSSLAERAARLEAVTARPVQKGDYVVGALSCRFLKGAGEDLDGEPLFLEAGSEENHPDFNAAILGMSPGESRSFETAYPDDYNAESLRGRTVAYTIAIKEIKKKVIPPLDDGLAREIGNFRDLDELRAHVESELRRQAEEAERAEAKDRILADLIRRHPIEVPESLVDVQVEGRLEAIVREMVARGVDPTRAPVDWREERERFRPAAVDSVRAMLILEAIAAQEDIRAGEEDVARWMRDEARRRGATLAAVKERFTENARLEGLRRWIVREKSLDFLLDGATITREET
ncbi:MAG: trigger factor [Acidobacteriota bacterium]